MYMILAGEQGIASFNSTLKNYVRADTTGKIIKLQCTKLVNFSQLRIRFL